MMITPLIKAINRRNEGIGRGWNFGERKERERRRGSEKKKTLRKREK